MILSPWIANNDTIMYRRAYGWSHDARDELVLIPLAAAAAQADPAGQVPAVSGCRGRSAPSGDLPDPGLGPCVFKPG